MNNELRQQIERIFAVLTDEQRQLMKDTINEGRWGDCDMEFLEDGRYVTDRCWGYITNKAKNAGNFSGRKVSSMFRSIYKRLGILGNGSGENEYFCYVNDWWEDGSGDVFFVRQYLVDAIEEWARE